MSDQPSLFDWHPGKPKSADLIPFPANRLTGKARRVAEVLAGKSSQPETARRAYWKRVTDDLARQFASTGFDELTIGVQLHQFKASVQRELDRLSAKGKSA